MTNQIRVLLVEDVEDDALLVIRALRRGGYEVTFKRVEEAAGMRAALEGEKWDIVLSDWSLPHFAALEALSTLNELKLDIPFIIVSGTIGEETAVAALRAGALDFVLKGNLSRLAPAVDRELRESASRTARRIAEENLGASEARYRALFNSSPVPMWLYDTRTLGFLAVNDAAVQRYGYSREEFARLTIDDIKVSAESSAISDDGRAARDPRRFSSHRCKDGEIITVETKAHDVDFNGKASRIVLANDVTERLRLEEQLRQSQKMEAIGRLAGGIAHDFNNVLSVILSYGEMLYEDLDPDDSKREDVDEIRKAGRRAADLTAQLLMFSRQQVLAPRVLDLNEVLTSMDKMLQRILGADVDLLSLPAKTLGRVRVDPSSIEQVIMNLVVNARDAMPTGGKLTMETANVQLDAEYARDHLHVKPGPYVMLAVSDTGVGMDKATMARMFEPFYTTKEKGKGTGLGLSTVFGIVQQSGGSVWVYSEPGKGTTFKIYLPQVDAAVDVNRSVYPQAMSRVGTETILLVEDDSQVRAVALGILRRGGYVVLEAHGANDALTLAEKHAGDIHLLLTDVVMPQMSGPELAKRLASSRPSMKVLCMSGYTDDSIVRHGVLEAHFAYLQKPLTPDVLAARVRDVLDEIVDASS